MSKINYKANKEFINKIRTCEYTGRELMKMMESRFKIYKSAGYPERYINMIKLKAQMGEDEYGNNLFGCVLSEIPSHLNKNWYKGRILSDTDKAFMNRYRFLKYTFPNMEAYHYDQVHNMFEDFLRTYNEPLVVAA